MLKHNILGIILCCVSSLLGWGFLVVVLLRSQRTRSLAASTYFTQLLKERETSIKKRGRIEVHAYEAMKEREREEEIKGSLGFGVFLIKICSFVRAERSGGYRVQTLCGSNRDFLYHI